jgi:predicted nucleic acid-binding protein
MRKLVLDSGIILSFLEGKFREYYDEILRGEIEPYINVVNLTEVYYVLCRKLGEDKAKRIVKTIARAGFKIIGVKPIIMRYAAECKCKYGISLADCFSIATAKYLKSKALFRREKELEYRKVEEIEFID